MRTAHPDSNQVATTNLHERLTGLRRKVFGTPMAATKASKRKPLSRAEREELRAWGLLPPTEAELRRAGLLPPSARELRALGLLPPVDQKIWAGPKK
jgi:hypothetical protein